MSVDSLFKDAHTKTILAPMAGYTDFAFREICHDYGVGLTVTEMVSSKALVMNSELSRKMLFRLKGDSPAFCQIFGHEPDVMADSVQIDEIKQYDGVDINMGCPMPKIYNNGEGSALMNNLPLASEIISAVKESGKAVSVKFRIGLDGDRIIASEFAKMCEDSGADMITVHGRTRDKIYAGGVNYGAVAQAKNAVKIPVIANGGVFCKDDAERLMRETGADGVAVARGAMYSPWIFAEICGKPVLDKKQLILSQLKDTREYFGERFACVFMRKMISFYIKGTQNSAKLRVRLFQCQTTGETEEILKSIDL